MEHSLSDVPLVVLAGGKATRLGSLGRDCPKYLQPVTETKCFADFHLDWIREQGFSKIYFSLGYLAEAIREYLSKYEKEFELHFVEDGPVPLGTGGAIKKISSLIKEDCLALTYGDTILNLSCENMLKDFIASGQPASMSVLENNIEGHEANVLLARNSAIYNKNPAPLGAKHIDYGFLFLRTAYARGLSEKTSFDLAGALSELSRDSKLQAFEVQHRFWEIGSPEALDAFRKKFS